MAGKKLPVPSPLWRARATFWRRGLRARQRLREDEIRAAFSEISFDDAPGSGSSDIQYFDTGYVEKLTVCGVEMTGVHVREALGLRSASFTVMYETARSHLRRSAMGTAWA